MTAHVVPPPTAVPAVQGAGQSLSDTLSHSPLLLLRQLQLGRLLDDFLEHLPRGATFGGPVALPHVGLIGGEDLREVAEALDALRKLRRDVDRARPLIAMLDQQPAAALPVVTLWAAAGADQHPRPLELHAVERELQLPLAHPGVDIFQARLGAP